MSESEKYFRYLVDEIHTTIMATIDETGLPVTAAIDMMDTDGESLYFLTAKGKSLYDRLLTKPFVSLTALKGEDTMSSKALTVRGSVRELGHELIPELFEKNPYMKNIYPTEESMRALTAFQIYKGSGEWFDLSKRPIERASFDFGTDGDDETELRKEGYVINDKCIGCGSCVAVCPQNCISTDSIPFDIHASHCLHCGNCMNACPAGAVDRR